MRSTIYRIPRGLAHRIVRPIATPWGRGASMIDVQALSILVPATLQKRAP